MPNVYWHFNLVNTTDAVYLLKIYQTSDDLLPRFLDLFADRNLNRAAT